MVLRVALRRILDETSMQHPECVTKWHKIVLQLGDFPRDVPYH
jgi:hypothetical protein